MKGISIRIEDDLHRRLKWVLLKKEITVQNFVFGLLLKGIEAAESKQKERQEAV